MKKWFLVGAVALVVFEIANVYFIMPLPYSQRVRSIDVAYTLYTWRWVARAVFGVMMLAGLPPTLRASRWRAWSVVPVALLVGGVVYGANVVLAADHLFLVPEHLAMVSAQENTVARNRLVVGVEIGGDARAYPVQFIGYHHQVRDTVGGTPVLVTFCTVCRTGRVFSPVIAGREERFRLVGMDHFNAMLEDRSTGSWWRQATGEAVTGERKGAVLAEIPSHQVTLALWLELHPRSRIMQADVALRDRYPTTFDYETGQSRSALTGRDTTSWGEKSWVVGVRIHGQSTAFDWNRLRRERAINAVVGSTSIVLVLASDDASFFTFARPDTATHFTMRGDSLIAPNVSYGLSGRGVGGSLTAVQASLEFWHSWRTFQPATSRY